MNEIASKEETSIPIKVYDSLTPLQNSMLCYLLSLPSNKIFKTQDLVDNVWGKNIGTDTQIDPDAQVVTRQAAEQIRDVLLRQHFIPIREHDSGSHFLERPLPKDNIVKIDSDVEYYSDGKYIILNRNIEGQTLRYYLNSTQHFFLSYCIDNPNRIISWEEILEHADLNGISKSVAYGLISGFARILNRNRILIQTTGAKPGEILFRNPDLDHSEPRVIVVEDLIYYPKMRLIQNQNGEQVMRKNESLVLELLIRRRGERTTPEEIMKEVWDKRNKPRPSNFPQIMLRLRELLEINPKAPSIILSGTSRDNYYMLTPDKF